MPITEKQRIERRLHNYSSDMAGILNLNPWFSGYDVWLSKPSPDGSMRITEEESLEKNYVNAGNLLEPVVLDRWAEKVGRIRRNQHRTAPEFHLGAHIDAIAVDTDPNEPGDAKTAGLFGPLNEAWGEEGSDQVPEYVTVQAQVHMICMGRMRDHPPLCHIPAFLGGRGFCMFYVPWHQGLVDTICKESVRFWNEHVLTGIPPTDSVPHLPMIRRLKRVPNKIVEVDPVLVAAWLEAKETAGEAKANVEARLAKLVTAMDDAEAADFGDPKKIFTYQETSRSGYTAKATTYRSPRLKKKP